jgi:cell wall-associated NlpC family hydrolase
MSKKPSSLSDSSCPGRPCVPRWLAPGVTVLVASAAALASAGSVSAASGHQSAARPGAATRMLVGQQIAAYAQTFIGRYRYKWGGNSPKTGFDCSGLTSYVYSHFSLAIPRTAHAQYRASRKVPSGQAWRGDLVFFHDTHGVAYHVGIYVGAGALVSATDRKGGIRQQIIDGTSLTSPVTFGTITH